MPRVTMQFEDGSKVDFDRLGDAVWHAHRQSANGVTGIVGEDGATVMTRAVLDTKLTNVRDQGLSEPDPIVALGEEV